MCFLQEQKELEKLDFFQQSVNLEILKQKFV